MSKPIKSKLPESSKQHTQPFFVFICAHAGAGRYSKDRWEKIRRVLVNSIKTSHNQRPINSELCAVECTTCLELSPYTNSGQHGASTSLEGIIECDACIATSNPEFPLVCDWAAVAALRNIPNPVHFARLLSLQRRVELLQRRQSVGVCRLVPPMVLAGHGAYLFAIQMQEKEFQLKQYKFLCERFDEYRSRSQCVDSFNNLTSTVVDNKDNQDEKIKAISQMPLSSNEHAECEKLDSLNHSFEKCDPQSPISKIVSNYKSIDIDESVKRMDTVGVVAIDVSGYAAATCSTSGLLYHRTGRLSHVPHYGAGAYATRFNSSYSLAITCTGCGENIAKVRLAERMAECLIDSWQSKTDSDALDDYHTVQKAFDKYFVHSPLLKDELQQFTKAACIIMITKKYIVENERSCCHCEAYIITAQNTQHLPIAFATVNENYIKDSKFELLHHDIDQQGCTVHIMKVGLVKL